MPSVETVRGPVDVGDLGTTLTHEHIHHDVLPALREQGVTEEQLTTMLVENPRRYFTAG
jgi:predicted metal-dependent phosphotriesterase family hydrolase